MIPYDWLFANYPILVTDEDYERTALDDSDSDHMSAWEEYIAGTSPTNRLDCFHVSDLRGASGGARIIERNSVSNRTYSVYSHTNLSTPWPPTQSSNSKAMAPRNPTRTLYPDLPDISGLVLS